jgi:hemerythrin-like domain-containing protein
MSNKLQNIKAINQMLDGTHKFQTKKTVGFSDAQDAAKRSERHEVGDVWEETDVHGVTYVVEQKDGFRIRKTKNSEIFQSIREEIRSFPNCRKDVCTCTSAHMLDQKMRSVHGMCFDCVIEMEHEMKKDGTFDEYARNKVRENALAWLQDAERDVELLKQAYTQAANFISNAEGETETWAAKMTQEEFEETIQKEFNKFKENFLNKLNGVETTNENN